MDASGGDQQFAYASAGVTKSKLRYPLRSAGKPREAKAADSAGSATAKRSRLPSTLRKSVNVLDLSATDKACKPPRRLSVPSKLALSPRAGLDGSITPRAENRTKKTKIERKNDSPISDIPKSTGKKKFTVLASVSYWLSQIKLSESASKHSISLGFFKLAKDAGCEPLQRMRDELKSYTLRHNIINELGDPTKELLQSYNILEDLERLKVSDSCSQIVSDLTNPTKEAANSSPAPQKSGNLKPRSLNSDPNQVPGLTKKATVKRTPPAAKARASCTSIPVNTGKIDDTCDNIQKQLRNSNKGTWKVGRSTKEATSKEADASTVVAKDTTQEDKENQNNPVEAIQGEEIEAV